MPSMDYLLGEISVDGPVEREAAVKAGNTSWPEGWWGVADDQGGYVAYFAHEADAFSYRMFLVNARMNLPAVVARYADPDAKVNADERNEEWVVGTEASNGTFFMDDKLKSTKDVEKAMGFAEKSDADNYRKHFNKPNTFVKRRRNCR